MQAVHEHELVERCRRGDERAFQELVNRYKDLVFALIARTTPDRSRAEDLAQDVFLRVHRGLPYFRGEARLSTWIYRIVANVCVQDRHGRPPATESLDDGRTDARGATSTPRSAVLGSRAARSARKGHRAAAGELSIAHRRALPPGRAVRGSRRSAGAAARHRQDAAPSRQTAASPAARNGAQVRSFDRSRFVVRRASFNVHRSPCVVRAHAERRRRLERRTSNQNVERRTANGERRRTARNVERRTPHVERYVLRRSPGTDRVDCRRRPAGRRADRGPSRLVRRMRGRPAGSSPDRAPAEGARRAETIIAVHVANHGPAPPRSVAPRAVPRSGLQRGDRARARWP